MQASSTTTTTKSKKLSSSGGASGSSAVAMTTASKTTTTTTTRKPATAAAAAATATATAGPKSPSRIGSDAHAEIEELSNKISEHADAIYHTWKSRGMPPAQLFEMYTNAAATGDFADVAVAAAAATASAAAAADLSNAEGLQKMVTSFVNKDKEQRGKSGNKKSEVGVAVQSNVNGKMKKATAGATTTTTTTTAAAAAATVKAGKSCQVEPAAQQALQSPKKVAAVAAKTQPDVNLNYDINLQLDVNNLSQQQTQQLLQISELLKKEAAAAAATAAKKRQSSNSSKAGSNSLSNSSSKLTAAEQPTKKLSKTSSNNNNSSSNSSNIRPVDVLDAPRVGVSVLDMTAKGASEPAIGGRKLHKTKENNINSSNSSEQQQKPATAATTKEKPTITRKLTNSSGSNNRSGNTDNSKASNIVANTTAVAAAGTDTPATLADTTMPTLNKTKPTSGSRAALTNGQDKNLGRPILTRGSVAERVLLFEKRPDVRNSFLDIKRPADAPPKSLLKLGIRSRILNEIASPSTIKKALGPHMNLLTVFSLS
ncbi:uncharacterized protein DDB_G0271670 isoform X3 [Drosophila novamexicana]|uniref:uncharacterized protein DDB_G0271670 isoform X3 n=1 Tax=Drosophila novamexicana TaxID=47314 RepID=UPI0011E591B0|nr:uncharacterized protein DDB_G0271670 isoform X3 [Drosophila novamexicana]